jgi:hypothetical protein
LTVRRLKTYAGSQGCAYQYYFVGKREAGAGPADAVEYVFEVTSDRKQTYVVGVVLPRRAVLAWAETHLRPLADSEQYAAVKLRLFRAFDELDDMQAEGRELYLDNGFLEESLASLGVE